MVKKEENQYLRDIVITKADKGLVMSHEILFVELM